MPNTLTLTSNATSETIAYGRRLGEALKPGDIVVLSGDLGAGKTQFTKGVAEALGYEGPVTSPTFNIQNVYPGAEFPLYHFDLYRLDDPEQLGDAGLLDALGEADGVCLIEWGEAFTEDIGDERLDLLLTRLEDGVAAGEEPPRSLQFTALGERAEQLLEQLK